MENAVVRAVHGMAEGERHVVQDQYALQVGLGIAVFAMETGYREALFRPERERNDVLELDGGDSCG